MNKTVERKIREIYIKVFNEVYSASNINKLSHGNRKDVLKTVARINSSTQFDKFAKKFAKELSRAGLRKHRGIWKKYYDAAKSMHVVGLPATYQKYEYEQMSAAIKHNFKMIKSIPDETLKIMEHKYCSALIEEVVKGKRSRGSFRKELEKHGHKNAKLIARTETAKLQTSIVENRAKDLGSVAYIWLSSNDIRTRPSHKKMNGVVVFWRNKQDEKPYLDNMNGNAGEFPNCRCSPQPIFDKNDLTKDKYDVWDYRNNKVISMSKYKLTLMLEDGKLS